MVKLNLKNTKTSIPIYGETGQTQTSQTNFGTALTSTFQQISQLDFSPAVILSITFKLALIACFPLGLKVYEIRIINDLKTQKKQVQATLSAKQKQVTSLEENIKKFDYLQEKSKEYKKKKDFLQGLASSRLIVPQLLEQVQTIIPESVWLKNIKIDIKEQKIRISGESLNEDRVNLFADSLKNIVNRGSIKVDTTDVKGGKNKTINKVSFSLEAAILTGRNF